MRTRHSKHNWEVQKVREKHPKAQNYYHYKTAAAVQEHDDRVLSIINASSSDTLKFHEQTMLLLLEAYPSFMLSTCL